MATPGTIQTNMLADGDKLNNLPADVNASLALKADKATTVTAGTGLSGGGDLSANRTINLANTAVTPGSYTRADITVDAQGRITAASSNTGGGTVTSVSSANTDIGVANSTTTPVLTLNSGTGANQIVKLDGTAKLPAVDGSQLTNLPSGSGTVTSVSVVSANGMAGTVANATTTPAITLSTSIIGLLKGDGTAISAAVADTDYLTPGTAASTYQTILTNSAGLAAAINDETGTGLVVFNNSPTFVDDITIGGAGVSTGSILLKGTTSGTVTIKTADAAGTYTLTLPTDDGNASQVLTTDGSGVLSWTTPAAAVPTTITVANEITDTTCFPLFVTAATGDLGPKTNSNLAFNSNTGAFTFGGTIVSISTSTVFTAVSGSTSYKAINLANTGGNIYVGVEQSTGGAIITGSGAYDGLFYSDTPISFAGGAAAVGMRLTATGLDVSNALTVDTSITVGTPSSATGSVIFKGTTSGTVTLSVADVAGTWTMKLPANDGDANQVLATDGSGNTSWVSNEAFSWGASITGTSGTGVTLTVGSNASAGIIGQNIIIDNTQANAVLAYKADLGTAAVNTYGFSVAGSATGTGFYYSGSGKIGEFVSTLAAGTSLAITANSHVDSTTGAFMTLSSSSNDATATAKNLMKISYSDAALATGTCLVLSNAGAVSGNAGLALQTGRVFINSEIAFDDYLFKATKSTSATVTSVTASPYTFASTRVLTGVTTVTDDYDTMTITRSDTFTNAGSNLTRAGSVLRLVNSVSASGALADTINILEISQDSDSTGSAVYLTTAGTGKTALKLDTGFTSATAPVGASTYILIDIGGTSYKLLAQATA